MSEIHLKQHAKSDKPKFTHSVRGPFTKDKEQFGKFMKTGDFLYIYQNILDEACLQHDMGYDSYKALAKKT